MPARQPGVLAAHVGLACATSTNRAATGDDISSVSTCRSPGFPGPATIIRRSVAALALGLTLAVPFTPAVDRFAEALAVPPRLEPADAIVVLGGGLANGDQLSDQSLRRATAAIRLYQRRLAPALLFSGGGAGTPEATVMAALAREVGVPSSAILIETVSTNTWTEAMEVARILPPPRFRRILLVTDPFHMRRSRAVFARAGFEVLPAPADPWPAQALDSAARLGTVRRVGQELVALVYYRARGWL